MGMHFRRGAPYLPIDSCLLYPPAHPIKLSVWMALSSLGYRIMRTAEGVHPPTKGYAAQYERLLMEELSLRQDRQAFLLHQSSSGTSNDNNDDNNTDHDAQQSLLKIRGMLHRTSLEGMLLSAQHAADEASNNNKSNITMSDNNGNASSIKNNNNYERGLYCPNAKNALVALLNVKSRQLEEEDNEIPLGIGSESLAWRQSFTSSFIGQEGATKQRGEGEGLVRASSSRGEGEREGRRRWRRIMIFGRLPRRRRMRRRTTRC